jgi:hypothetical protein
LVTTGGVAEAHGLPHTPLDRLVPGLG